MPLIFQKAPQAEFEDVAGIFIARFRRPKSVAQETADGKRGGSLSPKTTRQTTQETTQEKIVILLRAQPSMTRKALAERIGLTADGIKYHLDKLRSNGRIRHVGATKAGRWEVLK